jgi:hypothetical protein
MRLFIPFVPSSSWVTVIPRIGLAIKFFLNLVLTVTAGSSHSLGDLICSCTDTLTWILVTRREYGLSWNDYA